MPTVPPHSHREFRGVVEHTHPTSRSGVWRYSSNQTIADPGSGNLRWSADRLTLAMSKTTRDGVDAAHALAQVAVGDSIRVQVKTDATNAGWWEVTSVTDRGAWVEFGVTPTGGSPTAPANNTELMVTITYESSSVGVGNGGALTEADGDARYVNVTGDTMTGALTVDEGVQSNLYVRSASQRLWAMSRDSDLQSFLVSSDALNTAKRPLTIQASKVLLASGAESATDTNAVVPKSYVDGKVDKTGDTMTGNLIIDRAGATAGLTLTGSSTNIGAYATGTSENARNFYWDSIRRWKESQTPSLWAITRFDAAGANPSTALAIDNSNGDVSINAKLKMQSYGAVDLGVGRVRYDSGADSFVLDDVSGSTAARKGLILAAGAPTRDDHAANKKYVDDEVLGAKTYTDAKFAINLQTSDMNTIKTPGFYWGYQMVNAAVTNISTFIVERYSNDWVVQTQTVIGADSRTYKRSFYSGTTWGPWKQISGTNNATISPASGWTAYGSPWSAGEVTRSGDVVTATGLFKRSATGSASGGVGVSFATVPVGFRPASSVLTNAWSNVTGGENVRIDCSTTGAMTVMWPTAQSLTTSHYVGFSLSWRAA